MAGQLKINQLQLGDSATATQNFVLQTNVDGSCKLARGNVGATTQDILTVDAAGNVNTPVTQALLVPVKDSLNATGSAPIYACRAWVNFNGTGTVAIRASGNVSSITDNGVGDYTVNFTTAMPDANYVITQANDPAGAAFLVSRITTKVAASVRILVVSQAAAVTDPNISDIAVFR